MMRFISRSVAFMAVVGLLAVLWFKTQSVSPAKHNRTQVDLRELRQLDRVVNQDVLRVRFQLINSYDSIAQVHQSMDGILARLAEPPAYLDARGRHAFAKAIRNYSAVLDEKRQLIERLKSKNAVLRNSLRYFPTLAMETIGESLELDRKSPLDDSLNRLLQMILIYNLRGEPEVGQALAAELEGFVAGRTAYPKTLRGSRVDILARHAKAILQAKPAVDELVQDVFVVDVMGAERHVANTYQEAYARAERESGTYRMGLYGLCVLLIVLVAVAFARLQQALAKVREMNESLEEKVRLRTRELDARNQDMKLVFDTVEQGFLTVNHDGSMGPERSRQVEAWLGPYPDGQPFWTYLENTDPEAARWFRIGFDDLLSGFMLVELVVDQLPKRLRVGERHLELEYKPVVGENDAFEKMVVVVTDITLRIAQEAQEAHDRDFLNLIGHFARDRSGFVEFVEEARRLVNQIGKGDFADDVEAMRAVHTLKGNSSLFGVGSLAEVCHEVETRIAESKEPPTPNERRAIRDAWRQIFNRVQPLLDGRPDDVVELRPQDIESLRADIRQGVARTVLLKTIDDWSLERATDRLNRFAERSLNLADRLGIKNLAIEVDADCRLDPDRLGRFWAAFPHIVRNGLDHGIESPEERRAAGKPEMATLRFSAHRDDRGVVLEFSDDGRGINWNSLAEQAAKRGLPNATRDDLLQAMCTPGVSTKGRVTSLSGRGVGMNEVREATAALGGQMRVESEPGKGTRFEFKLPEDDEAHANVVVTSSLPEVTERTGRSEMR